MFTAAKLSSWVWRDGWVEIEDGAILSCQVCGHSFCIGPNGAFARDVAALPLIPRRSAQAPAEASTNGVAKEVKARQPFPGMGKPPTRV